MTDEVLISVLEDLRDNLSFTGDTNRSISYSCMRSDDVEGEFYHLGLAIGLETASGRLSMLLDSIASGRQGYV